jgi:hypothetical protein
MATSGRRRSGCTLTCERLVIQMYSKRRDRTTADPGQIIAAH